MSLQADRQCVWTGGSDQEHADTQQATTAGTAAQAGGAEAEAASQEEQHRSEDTSSRWKAVGSVSGALKDVTVKDFIAAALEGLAGLVRNACDLHAALAVCAVDAVDIEHGR